MYNDVIIIGLVIAITLPKSPVIFSCGNHFCRFKVALVDKFKIDVLLLDRMFRARWLHLQARGLPWILYVSCKIASISRREDYLAFYGRKLTFSLKIRASAKKSS